MADRFLIAPYDQQSGLQTDVRPWLIPDNAFSSLTNAYQFRGRVRKRFGSRWLANSVLESRFRVQVGTVAAPVVTPSNIALGQMFSAGTETYTVYQNGAGAALHASTTGTSGTATVGTTTFTLNSLQAGATPIYWYPALPVMGLLTYDQNLINDEFIVGFDTRYAYQYSGGWTRLNQEVTAGAATWSGSDSQFFWATTWTGTNASSKVFFVTNFNENEANFMRFLQFNTGLGVFQWDNYRPQISATPGYLNSARILVVFKNRLVALNTWEIDGGTQLNYQNRARYCQIGDPLDQVNAWRQDLQGRGNAIDAATTEAIITAEFIRDRLIVYFERSTWELVYTGNQAYPFSWQQINTELGVEATHSIVPFDTVALGVGQVGIEACNGVTVERIDGKIPNFVFDIGNDANGLERVYGIRDYFVEMVYWALPDSEQDSTFPYPNKVLVYNYKTRTWALNEDSITAFGYYQSVTGLTWDSSTVTWDDDTTWDEGITQEKGRQVIAGNQEGFTFICDTDETTNASVIQITDITYVGGLVTITAYNHNLRIDEFIYIEGITTESGDLQQLNGKIFKLTVDTLANPITANQFSFVSALTLTGTYSGGGLISRVSNINIRTKEYNFYAKEGRNAFINKADFMVDATASGQLQVNYFVSTASTPLLQDSITDGVALGTGTLDTFPYTAANGVPSPVPFEEKAKRLWHPVYFQADGEVIQFQLTMSDTQMVDADIREQDFQLHAICINAQKSSYYLL